MPLELKMSTGAKVGGLHWPDINVEQIVVRNLMRLHDTWEILVLKNRVVGLGRRLLIAADLWPFARAHERYQQILTERVYLRVIRKMTARTKNADRKCKGGKASTHKQRVTASGLVEGGVVKEKLPGSPNDSDTEGTISEESSSDDEYWREILQSMRVKAQKTMKKEG